MRRVIFSVSTILGPLSLLLGWIVLMVGARGPNFEWFLSHALLLGGIALMVFTIIGFRQLLGGYRPEIGDAGAGLTLIGAVTLAGQFSIDLAVGQLASDRAELSALMSEVKSAPGIDLTFHVLGPAAFYVGFLILITLLFMSRTIPWWAAAVAGTGIAGIATGALIVGDSRVMLFGFIGTFLGFLPVAWRILIGSMPGRQTQPNGAAAIE